MQDNTVFYEVISKSRTRQGRIDELGIWVRVGDLIPMDCSARFKVEIGSWDAVYL